MIHLLEPNILDKMLKNKEVFLIDVRERSEYEENNIEGSTLMPLGTLTLEDVENLNKDKKTIVIHCRSGGRSLSACKLLVQQNPQLEVYNLEGGITSWLQYKNKTVSMSQGGCATNAKTGGCSVTSKGGCSSK